jgi:hypothetical protein
MNSRNATGGKAFPRDEKMSIWLRSARTRISLRAPTKEKSATGQEEDFWVGVVCMCARPMKREAFFEWANLVVCVSRPTKGVYSGWYKKEREEKIFFWHQITFLECPAALARCAKCIVDSRGPSGFLCARMAQRDASQLFFLIRCVGWLHGLAAESARPVIIYSLPLAAPEIYAHLVASMRQLLPPKTGMRSQRAVNKLRVLQRKLRNQVPKVKLTFLALTVNILWSELKK